jgi:guanylate kinase
MKSSAQIFVLAGPSGVGKTTIAQQLLRHLPRLERSISCTTRPPRSDEREGRDYSFVNRGSFRRLIRLGQFLEWATVFDHYYGTPIQFVKERLKAGIDILLLIDVQGAAQLHRRRRALAAPITFLFVLPPSWSALCARLADRQSETSWERAQRLQIARRELEATGRFDHLIVNRRLDLAVRAIEQLIEASRVSWSAQPGPPSAEASSPLIKRTIFP